MRRSGLIACAVLATGLVASGARALECPLPQSVAKPGVMMEPESTIAEMAPLLSGANVTQRAADLVARTRKRYPAAQPAEIVNFLVTAYCPVANGQNISEAEKQALVNAFAAAVTQQLY